MEDINSHWMNNDEVANFILSLLEIKHKFTITFY